MTHDRTPGPPLDETGLQAIERRAEAATPGPWFWSSYAGVFSAPLAKANDEGWDSDVCWVANRNLAGGDTPNAQGGADLAFIADARTDIPALVDTLRAAWRERDIALGEVLLAESDRNTWTIKWESAEEAYQEAAADRDRYRAALVDLVAQVEAAEHTSMWMEAKSAIKRAQAALAAPGAGGPATEERTT